MRDNAFLSYTLEQKWTDMGTITQNVWLLIKETSDQTGFRLIKRNVVTVRLYFYCTF